ncbi:MAG: hypothetical protein AB1798_03365 [Spirochaetota bacterium]
MEIYTGRVPIPACKKLHSILQVISGSASMFLHAYSLRISFRSSGANIFSVRYFLIKFIFLTGFLFTGIGAFPYNDQLLIPITSPIYKYLDMLLLEAGSSLPLKSKPVSSAEVKNYLESIHPEKLSKAGEKTYNTITKELKEKTLFSYKNEFDFKASVETSLEGYIHSNSAVHWEYGWKERLPMLNIPFEFWFLNFGYACISAAAKENHGMVDENPNYTNLFSLISRSLLSYAISWNNLKSGKEKEQCKAHEGFCLFSYCLFPKLVMGKTIIKIPRLLFSVIQGNTG